MTDIETRRLTLRIIPLEALKATIDRNLPAVAEHLQLNVPEDWLNEAWVAKLRYDQWEHDPAFGPWSMRAIALRESGQMIGYINCHSAPQPELMGGKAPNGIEIGYMIFSAWREQGYALEAIRGFNEWAKQHQVESVILSISPENRRSHGLARRLGAELIGHQPERDGAEDIFLLRI